MNIYKRIDAYIAILLGLVPLFTLIATIASS